MPSTCRKNVLDTNRKVTDFEVNHILNMYFVQNENDHMPIKEKY